MFDAPAWLWPKVERQEKTLAIMFGRGFHYTSVALAVGLGCWALALPQEDDRGDFIVMGTLLALIGRGLRYIAARE